MISHPAGSKIAQACPQAITKCQAMQGQAGRDAQPVARSTHTHTHTHKQLKQKPQSRKAPHSHLCQTAWPLPPCPLGGESPAPALAPAPTPWSLGRGQPAGGLRPDPDTPPLTLLQELQTESHEGRMGVRDPETGKDRTRERGSRSGEKGGQGAGKAEGGCGARAPGRGEASKRGLQRKRHRAVTPARQM